MPGNILQFCEREMSKTKDTMQFLLRPPRSLVLRLDELAKKYGFDSGNEVAVKIVETYAEMWSEAEKAKLDVFTRQKEGLERAIQREMLKFPIKEATTESARPRSPRKEKQR